MQFWPNNQSQNNNVPVRNKNTKFRGHVTYRVAKPCHHQTSTLRVSEVRPRQIRQWSVEATSSERCWAKTVRPYTGWHLAFLSIPSHSAMPFSRCAAAERFLFVTLQAVEKSISPASPASQIPWGEIKNLRSAHSLLSFCWRVLRNQPWI